MLERYKKTFVPTQALILTITAVIYLQTRAWPVAATFFLIMQWGALAGALWAARLKRAFEQRPLRLR